jgi:Tol biopolymer transport system component
VKTVCVPVAVAALAVVSGSSGARSQSVSYWDPTWSPDGSRIAFVDRGGVPGDLYVMDADGTNVHKLTSSSYASGDYGADSPTWSPNGKRIAFRYGYAGISVVNVDGSGLHEILAHGYGAAWSPGGRFVAYAQGPADDPGAETSGTSIYVVHPDGTGKQLVASPRDVAASFGSPAWSRDGQRLAFTIGRAPDTDYTKTALGIVRTFRGRIAWRARGHYPGQADWAPDGRHIAFGDFVGKDVFVAVLDLKTGKVRRLARGWHPRFSPDGRRLLFGCPPPGICVMNADGSGLRRLYPR